MSARRPITLTPPLVAALRPLMTPTTPVLPRPVATSSQPNSRGRSATKAAVHLVEQLGMLMDIAAPGLNVGLQVGDAVDDGHENSRSLRLECFAMSTMQNAIHPTLPRRCTAVRGEAMGL